MHSPALHVVMYHYVRDLPQTRFPQIKGMLTADFRTQVDALSQRYEMATVESSLAFLNGFYLPSRDLCLLTFDDGLKEHAGTVTPLLSERGIQGVFFLITGCVEERRVAPVHMNHFLMADLPFAEYRARFLDRVTADLPQEDVLSEAPQALITYPWDTPEVAQFKYLVNFRLPESVRDAVITDLFEQHFGAQESFARELYLDWEEARAMQSAGMSLGGHTHTHRPISAMPEPQMRQDLGRCRALLQQRLDRQEVWPFSYPYGKRDSFTPRVSQELRELGFSCSFSTESGANTPGTDLFSIRRIDCKNA